MVICWPGEGVVVLGTAAMLAVLAWEAAWQLQLPMV
jgi:hypothetical protein